MLALLTVVAQAATRELWMWVDSSGVTHYSDRPAPGAKLVSITSLEPSGCVQPPASSVTTTEPAATPPRTQQQQAVTYSLFEIFEPENDEAFFGVDTVVNVRLRSEPELAPGDETRLFVDGKLVIDQPPGLDYSLSGLERGAHSIRAAIVDAQDKEKIRSEPLVFHIQQPSVVPPQNVGPNLRPRPRPTPRPSGT